MTTDNELPARKQFILAMIGVSIGIFYVGLFMLVTSIDWNDVKIIPEADAQILPFEQQLEQIRNPEECTRKVVQGASAEIPFTLKIFYDTTRDNKLEFKQQGTSFPIIQRTNQVMTFFTEEPDQYEIFMEMNYDTAEERQIYIEFLSNNAITQSTQEKFTGTKYCTTIFVNTIKPTPVPTKEEIFGESLDYIAQIPAMVVAFNANSQTSATSISYMWILLFAVVILSILTYINSLTGKKRFDSKMRDLDDAIGQVNTMTLSMDNLVRSVSEPLEDIKKDLKAILNLPDIKEKIPEKKVSKLAKIANIIPLRKKTTSNEVLEALQPEEKTTSDEVLKALQPTEEEIKEEVKAEQEPSGGFVIAESVEEPEPIDEMQRAEVIQPKEEKVSPHTPLPKEENPMKLRPEKFIDMLKGIDFVEKHFKEGELEKYTYNELNTSYGWIVKYRKWVISNRVDIPKKVQNEQEIAEKVIYYAIFSKMEKKLRNGK